MLKPIHGTSPSNLQHPSKIPPLSPFVLPYNSSKISVTYYNAALQKVCFSSLSLTVFKTKTEKIQKVHFNVLILSISPQVLQLFNLWLGHFFSTQKVKSNFQSLFFFFFTNSLPGDCELGVVALLQAKELRKRVLFK